MRKKVAENVMHLNFLPEKNWHMISGADLLTPVSRRHSLKHLNLSLGRPQATDEARMFWIFVGVFDSHVDMSTVPIHLS